MKTRHIPFVEIAFLSILASLIWIGTSLQTIASNPELPPAWEYQVTLEDSTYEIRQGDRFVAIIPYDSSNVNKWDEAFIKDNE